MIRELTSRKLALTLLYVFASMAHGQVSMQFSSISAALTNLSNSAGVSGIDGLTWGILVDSDDNGFAELKAQLASPYTASSGSELSPGDYFFYSGTTTTFPLGPEAGSGAATTTVSMDVYSIPEITEGDMFALIWFDNGISLNSSLIPGTNYGILTDASFILPSNGSSLVPFSSPFAGEDPIRPTNLKVGILMPPIETKIIGDQLAIECEIEIATGGAVTFGLESSITGLPDDWTAQSVTPVIVSDNGTRRTLRLTHPSTISTLPAALARVTGSP